MSDDKMTKKNKMGPPADMPQQENSVVKALDSAVWSEADAECKIRAKLQEFAAELQTIKTIQDVL